MFSVQFQSIKILMSKTTNVHCSSPSVTGDIGIPLVLSICLFYDSPWSAGRNTFVEENTTGTNQFRVVGQLLFVTVVWEKRSWIRTAHALWCFHQFVSTAPKCIIVRIHQRLSMFHKVKVVTFLFKSKIFTNYVFHKTETQTVRSMCTWYLTGISTPRFHLQSNIFFTLGLKHRVLTT